MANYYSRKNRSRLWRKEKEKSLRQAVFFSFLTVGLALTLIFLGIPALIRLAVFLGEIRSSSLPIENSDTVPPSPVQLEALPEATNSAQIAVKGYTEPGATVEFFLSGSPAKKVVAEADGTFNSGSLGLTEGRNQIYATATDTAGNQSQKSEVYELYYDSTPPEIEISEPQENQEFSGGQTKVFVKGKTEAKATITINDRLVIVDASGNFSYPLTLSEGENNLKIIVTDKAGNQAEKELTVTYSP